MSEKQTLEKATYKLLAGIINRPTKDVGLENLCKEFAQLGADWQSQQEDDKWISVEERLPEDYAEVLIYACTKEGMQVLTAMFCDDTDSQFTIHNWNKKTMGNIQDVEIIYWMNLPLPPIVDIK